MRDPWNEAMFRVGLRLGPQPVTIGGIEYRCFTTTTASTDKFVATRGDSLRVFIVDPRNNQAARIVVTGSPLAMSPWHVTAAELVARAAACNGVDEEMVREALTMHLAAGLVLTHELPVQLAELVGESNVGLHLRLTTYSHDGPGSARWFKACAEAIILLATPAP